MRCAVIEVSGNMISDLFQQEEQTDTTKSQIDSFFDLLEERALDVNPYCRSRLFQVYLRLLRFAPRIHLPDCQVFQRNSQKDGNAFASFVCAAWKTKAAMSGGTS